MDESEAAEARGWNGENLDQENRCRASKRKRSELVSAKMALSGMRGLSVFISDVRNCQNKEQERLRVDKELANIRTRFKNERVCDLSRSSWLCRE